MAVLVVRKRFPLEGHMLDGGAGMQRSVSEVCVWGPMGRTRKRDAGAQSWVSKSFLLPAEAAGWPCTWLLPGAPEWLSR